MTSTTIEQTEEYKLAKRILSTQFAKRSGLSYFNHVEEGLRVLQARGASLMTQQAYCLHPLVQKTDDFITNFMLLKDCDPLAVALVIEYRWVANNGTRQAVKNAGWKITLSDIPEVNEMLVADKIQNQKDYDRTFTGTSSDFDELTRYFQLWLDYLGINPQEAVRLEHLCAVPELQR